LAKELELYDKPSKDKFKNKGELLKEEVWGYSKEKFKVANSAYKFGKNAVAASVAANAFLGTVSIGMPAVTVSVATVSTVASVAVGAFMTGIGLKDNTQALRNRFAAPLKSTDYSPHLNPHKSVAELNQSAKMASGNSLAKTFVDVVKARIKG